MFLKKIKGKLDGINHQRQYKKTYNRVVEELERNRENFGLNEAVREEEIIVSLTSFPARFSKLHLVIESMLCQTMKPDKIILYLDDDVVVDVEELPDSLKQLREFGLQI